MTPLEASSPTGAGTVPLLAPAADVAPWLRFVLIGAAFFRRDLRSDFSYRLSFVLHALNIVLGVAAYYFLARFVDRAALGGADPFLFLLVGLAVNAYMSTWLVCFTDAIRTGQTTGTLKLIFASPLTRAQFMLFSGLYPSVRAALDGTVYLISGWTLGAPLANTNVAAAGMILLVSSFAFAAIGIGSAAFALVLKRGDPLLWLVTTLSWMLGGVLYPIQLLPAPLHEAARLLPITHAVSGIRLAMAGEPIADAAGPLMVFVIVAMPLSLAAFGAAVRRARMTGALGHV